MTTIEEHRALRAKFARDAIRGYNADGAASEGDEVQDLISDLLHYCDEIGVNALNIVREAIGNWSAEKRDPGNPGDGDTVEITFPEPVDAA